MQNFPKSIFIVDDDRFHLEIMNKFLHDQGINNISCYKNGVECLNSIHENPDVVFLDHQMDIYTGFETMRKIKRYNPNIFIVIVSAQEDIETAVSTLKYGAFDYIRKNENLEANIKGVISRIIEVNELIQANKPSLLKSIFNYL